MLTLGRLSDRRVCELKDSRRWYTDFYEMDVHVLDSSFGTAGTLLVSRWNISGSERTEEYREHAEREHETRGARR